MYRLDKLTGDSKLFLGLLLAVLFLFVQFSGTIHTLLHSLEAHEQHEDVPDSTHCEECKAYASLGLSILPNMIGISAEVKVFTSGGLLYEALLTLALLNPLARAPPSGLF